MKNNSFIIIEAAKAGRKKVHPVFAVILAIIFLTLGELLCYLCYFYQKLKRYS